MSERHEPLSADLQEIVALRKGEVTAKMLQRLIERPALLDELRDRLENDEIID